MRFPLLLLLVVASACASAPSTIAAPSNLPLEHLVLQPGERLTIQISPDPNASPPEANPRLFLEIQVTDKAGKPVTADSVQLDEQILYQEIDRFALTLSGKPENRTTVRITANGYETWAIAFRFNLKHSRHFTLPAQLRRKP